MRPDHFLQLFTALDAQNVLLMAGISAICMKPVNNPTRSGVRYELTVTIVTRP